MKRRVGSVEIKALFIKRQMGGATWESQNSSTSQFLQDILFIDENVGWAVGRFGVIVKTIDGGATWTAEDSFTSEPLIRLAFYEDNTLWAVGNNGVLLKQDDVSTIQNPNELSENILIYPNPVVDVSTITLNGFSNIEALALYDLSGQQLDDQRYIEKINAQEYHLSRKYLAAGFYILNVKTTDQSISQMIVVQE